MTTGRINQVAAVSRIGRPRCRDRTRDPRARVRPEIGRSFHDCSPCVACYQRTGSTSTNVTMRVAEGSTTRTSSLPRCPSDLHPGPTSTVQRQMPGERGTHRTRERTQWSVNVLARQRSRRRGLSASKPVPAHGILSVNGTGLKLS